MDSNKQEIATSLQFCQSAVVPFLYMSFEGSQGIMGCRSALDFVGLQRYAWFWRYWRRRLREAQRTGDILAGKGSVGGLGGLWRQYGSGATKVERFQEMHNATMIQPSAMESLQSYPDGSELFESSPVQYSVQSIPVGFSPV